MRVVALISGGKDSTYNMMQCIAAGHTIVALANLSPAKKTEIDSYMYQSVGFEAIDYIASAMELPLYKIETKGESKERGKVYVPTDEDEVEDLYKLLKQVMDDIEIDAVSCGAILSDYQRVRVENVCSRLGLVSLAYLWQRKQEELLEEMIKCEIDAVLIKVATLGLDPQRHLRRSIRLLEPHLKAMHDKYGLNVCGEGGEYESLTLDCPLYTSRIIIEESEIVMDSKDAIAPVGYLKLNKLNLEKKLPQLDLTGRLSGLQIKDSDGYVTDPGEDAVAETETAEESISDGNGKETFDNEEINQTENTSRSGDGWLWIGGITGVSDNNPEEAFTKAMDKLKCSLEANNHNLEDLCGISMYVADMSQYAELNKLYCETLNHVNPPTRACVQVPLPKHCPVILEAISWKSPNASGDNKIEKMTMHVQSISHWCPANIGPYSQAAKIGDLIHLAGQISMVPGSMLMVSGGIKAQCKLSLRHVERLLRGIDPNCDLRDVVQGICYLSDQRHVEDARKLWEEKTNNAIMDYIVVSGLPRNALVEWHVWGHTHNNQFEYEETGQCIQDWSISIFRRWNYENNIAAIVCHVDNIESNTMLTAAIFRETLDYVLQKLNQAHEYDPNSICNLKIFYPVTKNVCTYSFISVLDEYRKTIALVHTIVPVVALSGKNSFLSICGVRTQ